MHDLLKPFQRYAADGFYVARSAIPRALVQRLVERFHADAKRCRVPQLRQNGREEPNVFDSYGFMTTPLFQPHHSIVPSLARFRDAILDLACSAEMLRALAEVTLRPRHILQQTMMFEQAATPAHQDWVYLDSFPPGQLTAAWVALEDIAPDATRFFVVPGSQDFDGDFPEDWIWKSTRYTDAVAEAVRTRYRDQISMPDMREGDVLFWNSRTIHGSLKGGNPSKSRLSLTAHYIPEGFGFGNRARPLMCAHPFDVVRGRPIAYSPRRQ